MLLIIFMVITPLLEKDIEVRVPETEVENTPPPENPRSARGAAGRDRRHQDQRGADAQPRGVRQPPQAHAGGQAARRAHRLLHGRGQDELRRADWRAGRRQDGRCRACWAWRPRICPRAPSFRVPRVPRRRRRPCPLRRLLLRKQARFAWAPLASRGSSATLRHHMADELLIYEQTIEALFVRALGGRLTPECQGAASRGGPGRRPRSSSQPTPSSPG